MNLKDLIAKDISIFKNVNTIAETHTVNGISVSCIICNNTINNKNALNYFEKTLGISESDLLSIPGNFEKEATVTIDSVSYKIIDITECVGYYTLQLTTDIENMGLTYNIKYRNKVGTGANQDLGIPGTKTAWNSASTLSYTYFDKIINSFEHRELGIIKAGDVQIRVLTSSYNKSDLVNYEYYIDNQVYSLINNKIITEAKWHTLYLRLSNA